MFFFEQRIFVDLVLFGSVLFRIEFLVFVFSDSGEWPSGVGASGQWEGRAGCQGVRVSERPGGGPRRRSQAKECVLISGAKATWSRAPIISYPGFAPD